MDVMMLDKRIVEQLENLQIHLDRLGSIREEAAKIQGEYEKGRAAFDFLKKQFGDDMEALQGERALLSLEVNKGLDELKAARQGVAKEQAAFVYETNIRMEGFQEELNEQLQATLGNLNEYLSEQIRIAGEANRRLSQDLNLKNEALRGEMERMDQLLEGLEKKIGEMKSKVKDLRESVRNKLFLQWSFLGLLVIGLLIIFLTK